MSLPVSTVIPTRNRATLIARAIDSVLGASRLGDEVIVVDDGSTDGTASVLASYGDRIRSITTSGVGAGAARNIGVAEATHPFVAFLDSDDEWMLSRLELGRRLLEARPDIVFCFSDFCVRVAGEPERHHAVADWFRREPLWESELGAPFLYSSRAELPALHRDFNVYVGDLAPSLIEACPVAVQTLLIRRELAGNALRFADDLATYEDWECVIKLARTGNAAFLDCETAWQYGHSGGRITDAHRDPFVPATAHLKIIMRQLASDDQFMNDHGDRVRAALKRDHLLAAKSLLRRGESSTARAHLRRVSLKNRPYALLGLLPASMSQQVFAAYDWLGSKLGSDR